MYWSAVTTLVANDGADQGGDQGAGGLRRAMTGADQPVQDARLLDDAAEGERGDDQPDRVQHALHAAAGDELVDRRR